MVSESTHLIPLLYVYSKCHCDRVSFCSKWTTQADSCSTDETEEAATGGLDS